VIDYDVRSRDLVPAEVLILRETLIQLRHYNIEKLFLLSLDLLRAEWLLTKGLGKNNHLD
jgi:hypothetical protein